MEVKNAVISDWSIRRERGFLLDMWVYLDYGGSGQGFGGWALYLDESATHHKIESIAGHFIYRVMQVAGVESLQDLKGKTVRARCDFGKVQAIGHIVKDDWFDPEQDFQSLISQQEEQSQ